MRAYHQFVWKFRWEYCPTNGTAVILWHIVMVTPGTPLVKNHESQARTTEFQLQKKKKKDESKVVKTWAFMKPDS